MTGRDMWIRQSDGKIDGVGLIDRQMGRRADRQMGRLADGHTSRRAYEQMCRQEDHSIAR
jgi:hypothetical protein